jgi:hypothetical protein
MDLVPVSVWMLPHRTAAGIGGMDERTKMEWMSVQKYVYVANRIHTEWVRGEVGSSVRGVYGSQEASNFNLLHSE